MALAMVRYWPKADNALVHCKSPLSGVKRTWPFVGVRFRGRYRGQSGHRLLQCTCPLV